MPDSEHTSSRSDTAAARRRVIGELIRSTRERACRKPRELAEFLGISSTAMHAIESGERDATLPMLEAMAYSLGVPVHSLLGVAALPAEAARPPNLDDILRLRGHIIGALIHQARTSRGETLDDAAATLGVTGATLEAWEFGRRQPGASELETVITHYGIAWDELLDLGLGPIGEMQMAQAQRTQFESLPADIRAMVCDPAAERLLRLAARLHQLSPDALESVAAAFAELGK